MLVSSPKGHYRFLQGIEPYSAGVVGDVGHEIVRAGLDQALPWRHGLAFVEAHLRDLGLERHALCAIELRSPAPFTMAGFIAFNQTYCAVLKEWELYVGDLNPVARTNVAPRHDPPATPVLHAFSYTVPRPELTRPTFVVAGAGELLDGLLVESGIIRRGENTPAAMREKAAYVLRVMEERLRGLGGDWEQVSAVDVYTVHPLDDLAEDLILPAVEGARRHGLHWHHARPPVQGIEFEMDLRGLRVEMRG